MQVVTIEKLAEILEVTPNTIKNWESSIGLNIKKADSEDSYSEDIVKLFKKIKSLVLNGYNFAEISDFLSIEISICNEVIPEYSEAKGNAVEAEVIKDNYTAQFDSSNAGIHNNFRSTFNQVPHTSMNQSEIFSLFETLLKELKQYTDRTIEAEKKIYLLVDQESRFKKEYYEVSSEIKQLKVQLEEKEKKIKEFEEQKKRMNLMEVQLKLLQLEQSKKKPWELWK